MNPRLDLLLDQTARIMHAHGGITHHPAHQEARRGELANTEFVEGGDVPSYHVGVDLGTAYTVLLVLDGNFRPLAGEYCFANVVRDGLVVDFIGAIDLLRELKRNVESRLGFQLTHSATGFPPGVPITEVRATVNVVRAAGFDCRAQVDEPSAANAALQIANGAIVDVGGGTTGIAIVRDGRVVYTADEATGGTHFTLVIAGALDMSFEEAEALKTNEQEHSRLFPLIEPVMEKVGTIVARHIQGRQVDKIYMVGGTSNFRGIAGVVERVTGTRTLISAHPLFVTPLGIAMCD